MFDINESEGAAGPLAVLEAAVDGVLGVDLTRLSRDGLLDFTRRFEVLRRRLPVLEHRVVAELDVRGVPGEVGVAGVGRLLTGLLRISGGDAARRVRAARELGPRAGLDGVVRAARFARVAAAQADGVVSGEHAAVITATVDRLPGVVRAEHGERVEAVLVEHAARFGPDGLARLARVLTDALDPDGTLSDTADHQRRREVTLTARRDGSGHLTGTLNPATLALWQTVLDPLARPRPARDGTPDPRTPGQRTHDAFTDAAHRLLTTGALPDSGGAPTTLLLMMTAAQAATGHGLAVTGHGQLIPARDALHLADQATILTLTTHPDPDPDPDPDGDGDASDQPDQPDPGDTPPPRRPPPGPPTTPGARRGTGGILSYGRTRRYATPTQRHALTARDHGRSFPGCNTPPAWTQAHHITAWTDGGPTDLTNLTLLCGHTPPHLPPHRLDLPHDPRHPPLDPTSLDRPRPNPPTQPHPPPPPPHPHPGGRMRK